MGCANTSIDETIMINLLIGEGVTARLLLATWRRKGKKMHELHYARDLAV